MSAIRVIGVGNPLMGDDGLGIVALEQLQKLTLPMTVELIDGGCGGLNLAHLFYQCKRLLIIDAAEFGGQPGEIRQLRSSELKFPERPLSRLGHHFALAEVLQLAEAQPEPPQIKLFLMQTESCQPRLELSPAIRAAIPGLISLVHFELLAHGEQMEKPA